MNSFQTRSESFRRLKLICKTRMSNGSGAAGVRWPAQPVRPWWQQQKINKPKKKNTYCAAGSCGPLSLFAGGMSNQRRRHSEFFFLLKDFNQRKLRVNTKSNSTLLDTKTNTATIWRRLEGPSTRAGRVTGSEPPAAAAPPLLPLPPTRSPSASHRRFKTLRCQFRPSSSSFLVFS